ncbi:MAG: hypothetical protein ABI947_25685 [Chloroflexota bacterium]
MIIITVRPVAQDSPRDAGLGLVEGLYSLGLAQQMVWLTGLLTCGQCVEVFARLGQCQVRESSLWRQVQTEGARLVAAAQHEQTQVSPERLPLDAASADHSTVKGVGMDGGMVNIRREGWKEMKVGTVYDVVLRLEKDERSGEYVEMAHAQNTAYSAIWGG